MKKFFLFILLSTVSLSCLLFVGCNQNTEKTTIDPNEFKIEKISQEDSVLNAEKKSVLFEFTYTQEMFDYEIKERTTSPNRGELVIRYRINDEMELNICGNINTMYGIKYDISGNVLAHKPNEKVYFYIDLDPGDYNLTFYLEYAANLPYVLLRECSINFNVL